MYSAPNRGAYPILPRFCPGRLFFRDCLCNLTADQMLCSVCDSRRSETAHVDLHVDEPPRFTPPSIPWEDLLRHHREAHENALNARPRTLSLDGRDSFRMPRPPQPRGRATSSVKCHCKPAAASAAATDALLERPRSRTPTQGPLLNKCAIANFYNFAPGRRDRLPPPPRTPPVVEEIRDVEEEVRIPMFAPRRAPPSMRPGPRSYGGYDFDGERRGRSPARSFSDSSSGNSSSSLNSLAVLDGQRGDESRYRELSPPRGRPRAAAARSRIPIPIVPVRRAQPFERPRHNSETSINARCHPDCPPSPNMSVFRAEEERRLREIMRRQFARPYEPARARNRAAEDGVGVRRVRDRWESDSSSSSTEIGGPVQRCNFPGSRSLHGRGAGSTDLSTPSGQVPDSDPRRIQTATDDEAGCAHQDGQDGLRRPSSVGEDGGDASDQLARGELAHQPAAVRMSATSCSSNHLAEPILVQEGCDSEE